MTSIHSQDADFTFPVRQEDRKFLKFRWQNKLWRFRALPMGITCAPRLFTKLIKPICFSSDGRGSDRPVFR